MLCCLAGHSAGGALAIQAAYDLVQKCSQLDTLRQVLLVARLWYHLRVFNA